MGELITQGYEFFCKNNWCKVHKIVRLVLDEWKNENNIYVFNDHAKLGGKLHWKTKRHFDHAQEWKDHEACDICKRGRDFWKFDKKKELLNLFI